MSRPDKYSDAYDKEPRDEFAEPKGRSSKGPADEDFDDLDSSEELLGGHSAMGKEIKIGLGVILVLLVVLGVVVVRRVFRPSGETASADPEAAKETERQTPGAKGTQGPSLTPKSGSPSMPTGPSRDGKGSPSAPASALASDSPKGSPFDRTTPSVSPTYPRESGMGSGSRFSGFDRSPSGPGTTGATDLASGTRGMAGASDAGPWRGDASPSPGAAADRGPVNPFRDRPVAGAGSDWGTGASPARVSGDPWAADNSPRTSSPAGSATAGPSASGSPLTGSSPLGSSTRSFGPSGGNSLRETPPWSESGRGSGSTPRSDFADRRNDNLPWQGSQARATSPPETLPTPRPSDSSPRVVGETSRTPGLGGGLDDPAGRSGFAGRSPLGATGRSGRVYVVQAGDSIYDIARSELGSASRFSEIYELNRDVLARQGDSLTPGTRLVLPEDSGGSGILTRRPASGFMR